MAKKNKAVVHLGHCPDNSCLDALCGVYDPIWSTHDQKRVNCKKCKAKLSKKKSSGESELDKKIAKTLIESQITFTAKEIIEVLIDIVNGNKNERKEK